MIDDLGAVVNNGVVISDTANGGGWAFGPAVNNGSIVVAQGEISLDSTIAGGSITFNGPGAVSMPAMALTGGAVIAGFGQGDRQRHIRQPGQCGSCQPHLRCCRRRRCRHDRDHCR